MKETKWLGSTQCGFCKEQIKGMLFDAKTVYGCWATMCSVCYTEYSVQKLGTGYGQKYKENSNNEFIKVEG